MKLGVHCAVVAPTLVPVKSGDRVKTDRRDAEKLARCYRGGDLTPVWVPDAAHEALRDLVRARLAAKRDELRARHRLSKFLLRQGRRCSEGITAWTGKYMAWVKQQHFTHPAQEATFLDYLHEVEHMADWDQDDPSHMFKWTFALGVPAAPAIVFRLGPRLVHWLIALGLTRRV